MDKIPEIYEKFTEYELTQLGTILTYFVLYTGHLLNEPHDPEGKGLEAHLRGLLIDAEMIMLHINRIRSANG
jgi:hypothetical protein